MASPRKEKLKGMIEGMEESKAAHLDYYMSNMGPQGEYHKFGQNILKSNNVLVLSFDKYGILKNKTFLNKDDKNKILFSEKKTENNLTQRSFVERILQSIKTKMYGEKSN